MLMKQAKSVSAQPISKYSYDVSNLLQLNNPEEVKNEVCRIFTSLYGEQDIRILETIFTDFEMLYKGNFPGYHACDTLYHDIHHSLDVTLAMARLTSGYEQHTGTLKLGKDLFILGIACALFHDAGFIRKKDKDKAVNGSVYMPIHIQRSGEFLSSYLVKRGMGIYASLATRLLHFTGNEIEINHIDVFHPKHQELGNLLGTADLIAQMADRCYLEKCRDRLFPEFVLAGLTDAFDNNTDTGIRTAEDLLKKTPEFYKYSALERLENQFNGSFRYAGYFFQGQNLYMDEIDNNLLFIDSIIKINDFSLLRRGLPETSASSSFPYHLLPQPIFGKAQNN